MSFYETYYPESTLTLEEVKKLYKPSPNQYRDAKYRFVNDEGEECVIYNYLNGNMIFYRRKNLEKNSEDKFIVDCDKYGKEHKDKFGGDDFQYCDNCGKHKMYHSIVSKCKFAEKVERTYRIITLPYWLKKNDVEFINKRDTDKIIDVTNTNDAKKKYTSLFDFSDDKYRC
jgi:hypothetical protein